MSRNTLDELLGFGAKVAVAGSILVYGAGFLIAVPHYVRLTVPLHALDPVIFLAAGSLFWTLTAMGIMAGASAAKLYKTKRVVTRRQHLVWIATIAISFLLVIDTLVLPIGQWRGLVYTMFVALIIVFSPHNLDWPSPADLPFFTSDMGRRISCFLAAFAGFSGLVYPYVSLAYGGGKAQSLAKVGLPGQIRSSDQWMNSQCRVHLVDNDVSAPICRYFFRIYETTTVLYLGIAETPGSCSESWIAPAFQGLQHRCIQRLSVGALDEFEVDETRWPLQ